MKPSATTSLAGGASVLPMAVLDRLAKLDRYAPVDSLPRPIVQQIYKEVLRGADGIAVAAETNAGAGTLSECM